MYGKISNIVITMVTVLLLSILPVSTTEAKSVKGLSPEVKLEKRGVGVNYYLTDPKNETVTQTVIVNDEIIETREAIQNKSIYLDFVPLLELYGYGTHTVQLVFENESGYQVKYNLKYDTTGTVSESKYTDLKGLTLKDNGDILFLISGINGHRDGKVHYKIKLNGKEVKDGMVNLQDLFQVHHSIGKLADGKYDITIELSIKDNIDIHGKLFQVKDGQVQLLNDIGGNIEYPNTNFPIIIGNGSGDIDYEDEGKWEYVEDDYIIVGGKPSTVKPTDKGKDKTPKPETDETNQSMNSGGTSNTGSSSVEGTNNSNSTTPTQNSVGNVTTNDTTTDIVEVEVINTPEVELANETSETEKGDLPQMNTLSNNVFSKVVLPITLILIGGYLYRRTDVLIQK